MPVAWPLPGRHAAPPQEIMGHASIPTALDLHGRRALAQGARCGGATLSASEQRVEPVKQLDEPVAADEPLAVWLGYAGLPGAELSGVHRHAGVTGAERGQ